MVSTAEPRISGGIMSRPINTLGFLTTLLVLVGCLVSPCHAQDSSEKQIDTNLLTLTTIKIDCSFGNWNLAQDCVKRILPTLSYRAAHYIAHQTTFLLRVTYKDFPDLNNASQPSVSSGSAFLVDRDRRYFLTAKHVLLGSKVWATHFPPNHPFVDLETGIEDYLQSSKVEITLQEGEGAVRIPAKLIALDRHSDLALISVDNPNAITLSLNFPALFQNPRLADSVERTENIRVAAIGFAESPESGKLERQATEFGDASCVLFPKTYSIGGQKYRVVLFSTKSAFKPGFSGGPVLDTELRLVGVVSGATPPGLMSYSYFVPLSAVRSFLAQFR
jgi:S1-C subfamily serine protease